MIRNEIYLLTIWWINQESDSGKKQEKEESEVKHIMYKDKDVDHILNHSLREAENSLELATCMSNINRETDRFELRCGRN